MFFSTSTRATAPTITVPTFAQIYEYESPNQHGGTDGTETTFYVVIAAVIIIVVIALAAVALRRRK